MASFAGSKSLNQLVRSCISPAKCDLAKMGLGNLGSNIGHQVQSQNAAQAPDVTARGHMASKGCPTQEQSYLEATGFKPYLCPRKVSII